jgi:hypothetical protein
MIVQGADCNTGRNRETVVRSGLRPGLVGGVSISPAGAFFGCLQDRLRDAARPFSIRG